jgi:hypothetical protein
LWKRPNLSSRVVGWRVGVGHYRIRSGHELSGESLLVSSKADAPILDGISAYELVVVSLDTMPGSSPCPEILSDNVEHEEQHK